MRGPVSSGRTSDSELRPILDDIPRIVGDPHAGDLVVRRADKLGKLLKDAGLKMAQVRTIFDELRQIESLWMQHPERAIRRLHLLKPKLAYQTARMRELGVRELGVLAQVIEEGINAVFAAPPAEQRDHFQRLMEFMEAILAYHKAHGGGD